MTTSARTNIVLLCRAATECVCMCLYLQSQSEVAALCVSDQAGRHGAVGPPAPLEITHGVLVQVAGCHQGAAGSQTSRRELQTALSCQETGQRGDEREVICKTWGSVLFLCWFSMWCWFLSLTVGPYHRGVTLRNTFNPMSGPRMSPAPNSTYRDQCTETGDYTSVLFLILTCIDEIELLQKRLYRQ